jgi:hypothetical protein
VAQCGPGIDHAGEGSAPLRPADRDDHRLGTVQVIGLTSSQNQVLTPALGLWKMVNENTLFFLGLPLYGLFVKYEVRPLREPLFSKNHCCPEEVRRQELTVPALMTGEWRHIGSWTTRRTRLRLACSADESYLSADQAILTRAGHEKRVHRGGQRVRYLIALSESTSIDERHARNDLDAEYDARHPPNKPINGAEEPIWHRCADRWPGGLACG